MAPEQVTNFSGVTHHADIYSFGAILHDIYNGTQRIPYKKLSAEGAIGTIIEKCTDEKIYRRFNDVKTLRDVLLAQLSKEQVSTTINESTTEWIEKLKSNQDWTIDELDSFIMYTDIQNDSKEIIFMEFTSDLINNLYKIEKILWKQLMLMYFDWIQSKGFNFDYCDVIIGHIYKAYSLTEDLEVKSKAVITSAELGKSHNRWYVMKYVVEMSSPSISEQLADRLSIEIYIEGKKAKINFNRCVEGINLSKSNYHPKIEEAILN